MRGRRENQSKACWRSWTWRSASRPIPRWLDGAVAALAEATGVSFEVFDERAAEACLATARLALGEGAAGAAWAAGQTMAPDEAVRYALAPEERVDTGPVTYRTRARILLTPHLPAAVRVLGHDLRRL
jgi:hypothetical protein